VSGDFHDTIYAILKIQYRSFQTDIDGNDVNLMVEWVYIGFFSASRLGIDHDEWRKVIIDREILNEMLS